MAKPEAHIALFRTILKNNLSVRQAEERARRLAEENKAKAKGPKNPFFQKTEKDLREVLGRRVSILKRGDTHYINIEFTSDKELDKLTKYLMKI